MRVVVEADSEQERDEGNGRSRGGPRLSGERPTPPRAPYIGSAPAISSRLPRGCWSESPSPEPTKQHRPNRAQTAPPPESLPQNNGHQRNTYTVSPPQAPRLWRSEPPIWQQRLSTPHAFRQLGGKRQARAPLTRMQRDHRLLSVQRQKRTGAGLPTRQILFSQAAIVFCRYPLDSIDVQSRAPNTRHARSANRKAFLQTYRNYSLSGPKRYRIVPSFFPAPSFTASIPIFSNTVLVSS